MTYEVKCGKCGKKFKNIKELEAHSHVCKHT